MHCSTELLYLISQCLLTLILFHFQMFFYCSVCICMALFAIFIRERERTCLHLNAIVPFHRLVHGRFKMSLDIWQTRVALMHPMAVWIRYWCFLIISVSADRNKHFGELLNGASCTSMFNTLCCLNSIAFVELD